MERQDAKRALTNDALTDKNKSIALPLKEESTLLSFEGEMRAAANFGPQEEGPRDTASSTRAPFSEDSLMTMDLKSDSPTTAKSQSTFRATA